MPQPEFPRALREIRARFDGSTIRVYQAYSPRIAMPAVQAQKFVPPFKRSRMTWIKPSFTWMMYRSGWAEKTGQEHILGIDITREGFEWALAHSCLSHFDPRIHGNPEAWETQVRESPVRIQWDPERDLRLQPLGRRAIQIGLGPEAVDRYVDKWIVRIEDITESVKRIHGLVKAGDLSAAKTAAPVEIPYSSLPREIGSRIGITLSDECLEKSVDPENE